MKGIKFIYISLVLLYSLCSFGQSKQPTDSLQSKNRPKIGLVLSGGGAKGLAHIGVLKVLEEAGVKIDYIGGTSMGAIVGSLYASGYNASQLDSIFNTINTERLIDESISRTNKSFSKKSNDEKYAFQLTFDDFLIGTLPAINKGIYNAHLFSKLLAHVREVSDFQSLPIPFLCIATDATDGEMVVLKKGFLPISVMASAAFPSLYAPVEIDGRLLIDGGVTNNYPIDEVKEMGADIIIGVDVQGKLKSKENLKGASDILLQIISYGMYKDMPEKREETDVYIKPNIKEYSVVSFDKGTEIINQGEIAAKDVLDQIKKYSTNYHKPKLVLTSENDSISIAGVTFNENINPRIKKQIQKAFGGIDNQCVPFSELTKGIDKIITRDQISNIHYSFKKEKGSDLEKLCLDISEMKNHRFLKFSYHYDELNRSSFLFNITQRKLLFSNDLISADFMFGDNLRSQFDYYVDNGLFWSFGIQSKVQYLKNTVVSKNFYIGASNVSFLNYDFRSFSIDNKIYVQTYFNDRYLFELGSQFNYYRIKTSYLPLKQLFLDKSIYVAPYTNLKLDTRDNKYFPKRGAYFNAMLSNYIYSTDYNKNFEPFSKLEATVEIIHSINKNRISFSCGASIGAAIGPTPSLNQDYFLGGFGFVETSNYHSFLGYPTLSLVGNSFLKVRANIDYNFYKKHYISATANYAVVGDRIFDEALVDSPSFSGYALGYGVSTIAGPFYAKLTYSPEINEWGTVFSFGYWF